MNKRFKFRKIVLNLGLIATLLLFILPGVIALAQEDYQYTVLAPLPGTTDCSDTGLNRADCKTTLEQYIPAIFNLAIGLSAAAAVLIIIYSGLKYMTTDAIQGKEEGKTMIWNAIKGLVLVIGAYLILYTVNPNLLNLNLNIEPVTVTAPKGTLGGESSAATGKVLPGYTLTAAEVKKNNEMRMDLKNNYNVFTNAPPCAKGETSGCTNLVGMTPAAFKGVTDLKKACAACNVTISGGTEGGHASHGPNLAPIDLQFDARLDKYIIDNKIKEPMETSLGPIYTTKIGNRNATFLKESNPNHWHVVFE